MNHHSEQPVAPICPYCNAPSILLMDTSSLYASRKNYGPAYACHPCEALVGCHPGTTRPLGRLANKELRAWKIRVHAAFDPIWQARLSFKQKKNPRYTKAMARGGRYRDLAVLMGIPSQACHIGMFDIEQCKQAIDICKSGKLGQYPGSFQETLTSARGNHADAVR